MKCVYNKLFDYIVRRINEATYRLSSSTIDYSNHHIWNKEKDAKSKHKHIQKFSNYKRRSIGLLDIFGFEDIGFLHNNFEQLCINYLSELIHQFYIRKIFKIEQIEYEAQNIEWQPVAYVEIDNFPLLELFSIQPISIFSLINNESINLQVCQLILYDLFCLIQLKFNTILIFLGN